MSIRFHCQACGKSIATADSSAGRHGKCPACGAAVEVPAAGPPDSPTPPATAPLTRTGRPATPPAPPPLTKTLTTPRVFRRGEVVQILCGHPKTGWFSSRSLVALVQDRPAPRRRGLRERLTPPFLARRRIFYMAFDDGEQAADEAAKRVGQVLGLEVIRATVEKRKGLVIP